MTTDTASVVRAWILALSVSAMVGIWLVLARTPFPTPARTEPAAQVTPVAAPDPRIAALQRREAALRLRAAAVQRRYDARWAAYREALGQRQAQIRVAAQQAVAVPAFTTSTPSYTPAPSAPSAPSTSTRSS